MSKRHKSSSSNNNNSEEPPAKKSHGEFEAPTPSRSSAAATSSGSAPVERPVTPEASHIRPVTPESISKSPAPSSDNDLGIKDDALAGIPITEFRVSPENVEQLKKRGIVNFFPIQSGSYDYIYDGYDVVGRAQTGSGKTLSFVLPIVERIISQAPPFAFSGRRKPKVICVAPTRELARQNAEEFERCTEHAHMKTVLVYGGTQIGGQCRELNYGSDIIVGTPGRIIDLSERNALDLSAVECVICK